MATVELLAQTRAILADLVAFESVTETSNLDIVPLYRGAAGAAWNRIGAHIRRRARKSQLVRDIRPRRRRRRRAFRPHRCRPGGGRLERAAVSFESKKTANYSRAGAADMKGFIACALACAPAFAAARLRRPIHLALSFDEESRSAGAPILVAAMRQKRAPAVAIVGEPTMMKIVAGHKAGFEATTDFFGVAAHASDPRAGVNAAFFAARFVCEIEAMALECARRPRPRSDFEPPYSTLSVGVVVGGVARNMLPQTCEVAWEYRPLPDEDAAAAVARIEKIVARLDGEMRAQNPRAGAKNRFIDSYPGLPFEPDSPALRLARELLPEGGCEGRGLRRGCGLFSSRRDSGGFGGAGRHRASAQAGRIRGRPRSWRNVSILCRACKRGWKQTTRCKPPPARDRALRLIYNADAGKRGKKWKVFWKNAFAFCGVSSR